MTNTLEQQVSAFVDGELSAAESELFVKRLAVDERLQAKTRAYHTIGSMLRGERSVAAGFAEKVAEQLREESTPRQAPASGKSWRHYLAGGAIAATVATLALLGLNQSAQPGVDQLVAESASESAAIGDTGIYTVPAPSNTSANPGLAEPQLVNYMLRHGRVTPLITRTDLGTSWVPNEQAELPGEDAKEEATQTGDDDSSGNAEPDSSQP